MDATIKAQWTEALRSGKYKQGQGKLQEKGQYCCLGVLCELSPVVKAVTRTYDDIVGYEPVSVAHGDRDVNYPPTAAWLWAGWQDKNPFVETGPSQTRDGGSVSHYSDRGHVGHYLSNLNDAGFTFNQIADLIEYFL